jgi:hypothetical protein
MKKLLRRRWVLGALLLLAVVGGGYLLVPATEGRISQASCDRIQLGWSFTQVANLLGENRAANQLQRKPLPDVSVGVAWYDEDSNRIEVYFQSQPAGGSLEVTQKKFVPTGLSFFERMQARLQRRIRALWP